VQANVDRHSPVLEGILKVSLFVQESAAEQFVSTSDAFVRIVEIVDEVGNDLCGQFETGRLQRIFPESRFDRRIGAIFE
jgi:hypothetical protein